MPSSDTDKYAPTIWGTTNEYDFTTPSGQVCRLRRMDPVELIGQGLLSSLDFLTGDVLANAVPNGRKTAMQKAKENKEKVGSSKKSAEQAELEMREKALRELLSNPERMSEFTKTLDKVLVAVVIAPPLHLPPQPSKEGDPKPDREEGLVYTDTVDFNDKMAIFNRATAGVTKLEPFREESAEPVGTVAPIASVRSAPKRAPRRK